jgi:hypothetical protein
MNHSIVSFDSIIIVWYRGTFVTIVSGMCGGGLHVAIITGWDSGPHVPIIRYRGLYVSIIMHSYRGPYA